MAYLLTAFGHQAVEAHEGQEGIEMARREKPDLILLDIHMPRMDGYEVVRVLTADPECSHIPVVAVTALAMVGDRERILSSGFSGYIAKPIDPETFAKQVQGHLGKEHSLPMRRDVPMQQQNFASTYLPRQQLAVVLVVDNTPTNIDLVRSTLEPCGYEVFAAPTANEGLDLAQRIMPNLIVSDVHMLHKDGYEFLRMVRSDPNLSEIPFIFLSSSVQSQRERERARELGAAKFISRPIDPVGLLSEIAGCLRQEEGG